MHLNAVHRTSVFAAVLVFAVPTAGAQTPVPLGGQFTVNSDTRGNAYVPRVATDGSGDFVVVWYSYGVDNGDTSGYSMQGRRFAAGASPVGDQFLINTVTTGYQYRHEVAMNASGSVVVAWTSDGPHAGDNSGFSVQAQRFDADGSPVGGEFLVNSYTTSHQGLPAVAMDESGDFVVVWQSVGSDNGDTSGDSIQGQRFDADVGAVGPQFLVNSYTTGSQFSPVVGIYRSGDFVVFWDLEVGSDIPGQRFAADGSAIGTQFQAQSYTTGGGSSPAVAANGSDGFVVVWVSTTSHNGDTSGSSIQARLFDSDGSAVGAQFLVNSYTTGSQRQPDVAVDESGEFVVVWLSHESDNGDTSYSIQGQRFAADGSAMGSQFLVNSLTEGGQHSPAIGMNGSSEFVVVWEDDQFDLSSPFEIKGRRFQMHIFSDGFESGDVSAWSSSVP